jgi:hypothetical protein
VTIANPHPIRFASRNRLGQISVSRMTTTDGRRRRNTRRTHHTKSKGAKKTPSANPARRFSAVSLPANVVVLTKIGVRGVRFRISSINATAAMISPTETACNQIAAETVCCHEGVSAPQRCGSVEKYRGFRSPRRSR